MLTRYKIFTTPCQGFGKIFYNPCDWLNRDQTAAFLKIPPYKVDQIVQKCTRNKFFRASGAKITKVRRQNGVHYPFESVCYLYQYVKKSKEAKSRQKYQNKQKATYYEREYKAFIRGELGTRPKGKVGHFESIRDLGLDPLKGRS